MAYNKVTYLGKTLIDLSNDTVDANHLAEGYTAHDSSGEVIIGTMSGDGATPVPVTVGSKQVNFYDYEGTLLYSYTKAQLNTMESLPNNPSHEGLTAQGWNWTLAQIKTQLTTNPNGAINVGQMYITDDGKTRLYCYFKEGRLSPYLGIAPKGTINIDWGDGTQIDSLTGTSLTTIKTIQHNYESAGNYIITFTIVNNAQFAFYGTSSFYSYILRKETSSANSKAPSNIYRNAIQKIEIGSGAEISNYAFYNCLNLSSITVPSSVASIGNYAFYNCYNLSFITIPSGVTSIGTNLFYACYNLFAVAVPLSVTSIGVGAFQNCYNSSIVIPSGVTSIENSAFYNCYNLSSIIIPSNVTNIGNTVFYGCNALSSITIPSNVTSVGNSIFQNCEALSSVVFLSNTTNIGNSIFSGCYSLSSVIIPSNITKINDSTFSNCYNLSSITIPSNVTSIGTSAFSNCNNLSSITIPLKVTSINASAFSGCQGMKAYYFKSTIPPTLSNINAFNNIPSDCIIYVPRSENQTVLESYKTAANWSTYANQIQEEPEQL